MNTDWASIRRSGDPPIQAPAHHPLVDGRSLDGRSMEIPGNRQPVEERSIDGHPADGPFADRHLVDRAARGEPGAFGLLYQRHVEVAFRYVSFRVRDAQQAEDLTQEIFISAFRGIATLTDGDRFVAWLLAIARNRLLNHWRSAARRPGSVDLAAAGDEDASAAFDPLAALDERVSAEALLAGASRLTELQEEVLALRFVSGLSVSETAAAMGRSESAVKNLQHHALAALRRHIEARSGER